MESIEILYYTHNYLKHEKEIVSSLEATSLIHDVRLYACLSIEAMKASCLRMPTKPIVKEIYFISILLVKAKNKRKFHI